MNLSFLYNSDDFITNIYNELREIDSIEVYHNGYYLPIYFKKSQYKVGKEAILKLLQKYPNYKLNRYKFEGKIRYRIMNEELC